MFGLLLRIIRRVVIDLSILTCFFLLAPGLPPYNATFSSMSITPPRPLTGALEPNGELDLAVRLFEGKLTGPESFAWKTHDEIFVSIHGGTVIKIFGKNFDRIARVARIGPPCAGPWQERLCGRPLGLRFAPDGKLLVADAYYGIFSVDVDSGEKECLVSPDHDIEGSPFKLANDLDIDDDGNIYWSDSSTIADLTQGALAFGADPTGRLIKYDPKTGSNVVLLKDISFANGVQLSSNQDFVLLAESGRNRIHRYWLKGDMAGQSDIFLDGLPGVPDNIRPRPDGGTYISLIKPTIAGKTEPLFYFIEHFPLFRKLAFRILSVAQFLVDNVNKVFPLMLWERMSYNALNLGPLTALYKSNISIVVEADEEGNIIDSLQGSRGVITFVSETAHVGDNIFFGSPYNNYIGRLYVGEPIAWEAEVIGGDYTVRMVPEDQDGEEPSPSAEEEPPVPDTPLFEAMGEGVTMKEPKEEIEEVETEAAEKLNDLVEGKEEAAEVSSEHKETKDDEQPQQTQLPEEQESEQADSKEDIIEIDEQIIESESQHVETADIGATTEETMVNALEEDVIEIDDAAKKEEIETVDAVQEEDIEAGDAVQKEYIEVVDAVKEVNIEAVDAVEEENIEAVDAVEEENIEAVDAVEEKNIEAVDAVEEEDIEAADAVEEDVKELDPVDSEVTEENQHAHDSEEHLADGEPQEVEEPIAVSDPQLMEELVIDEQKHEQSELIEENKEQAPHIQESKDEL